MRRRGDEIAGRRNNRHVLDVAALAAAVGRSPGTVRRWMRRDDWPLGQDAPFSVAAVRRWAAEHLAGSWGFAQGSFRSGRFGGPGAYHDAARIDTTTADWRARLASADQAILDDLDTMLARSRMEIANNGYAASAQGAFRRYVVGGGITARAAARHPDSGEFLTGFNRALDAIWEQWAWDERACDAEQRKSLVEKQQLWMNELFAAGGLFINEAYRPQRDRLGFALQEIEYEQRDSLRTEFEGRPVREGVETGQFGEPLAYHVHAAAHPLEQFGSEPARLSADRCYHLYRQDRVRQCLGAPWLRPVLLRIRNLAMYDNYTMVQARTRAAYPGFVEQTQADGAGTNIPAVVARQLGAPLPAGAASDPAGELRVNLAPGVMPILRFGQKVAFPNPGTPDTMYPPFVLEQLKGISAGTGLDLTTVARWYADGNFSSQRQAKLDIWAEMDWIQDTLFIAKTLRRVRRRFIELAVAERRLRAIGFDTSDRWTAVYLMTNWQGPPRASIDEIKDQAAWDLKFKSLRASPQEYFNLMGLDARQVLSEWQEFLRMARYEYGLGDVLGRYFGSGTPPNRSKAGMAPDDPARREARGNGEGADLEDEDNDLSALMARREVLAAVLGGANGDAATR